MRVARRFLVNGLIMAATALLLRFVGLSFSVYFATSFKSSIGNFGS